MPWWLVYMACNKPKCCTIIMFNWYKGLHDCPTKKKCSMCISDYMQATSFNLGRFLKKLADDQCSTIAKGSIYHIKHMSIQPFTIEVDWSEIGFLIEVSTMFNICTYCVFTWYRIQVVHNSIMLWFHSNVSFINVFC